MCICGECDNDAPMWPSLVWVCIHVLVEPIWMVCLLLHRVKAGRLGGLSDESDARLACDAADVPIRCS